MKSILLLLVSLILINCQHKIKKIEDRTVGYYIKQAKDLQVNKMIKQGVLKDSVTIADEFRKTGENKFNEKGFEKYINIKVDLIESFFKDHLYMQSVTYADDIYVLYFSLVGFDDMTWTIVKYKLSQWKAEERLNKDDLKKNDDIEKILWNYDEGPKNMEDIRIFIKNDYLVMERGGLYHSLYNLKNNKVILNETSPWGASGKREKTEINQWIKENLHDKIEVYLR